MNNFRGYKFWQKSDVHPKNSSKYEGQLFSILYPTFDFKDLNIMLVLMRFTGFQPIILILPS